VSNLIRNFAFLLFTELSMFPFKFSNVPIALGNFHPFSLDIGFILPKKSNAHRDLSFPMEIGSSLILVLIRERLEFH